MASKSPLVSVLIGTYNPRREHFMEAIKSMTQQTYRNLEIIVVNDGSTVNVLEMIQELNDDRIILINNSDNKGLTKCLNQGLACCKGDFIARMDDDDICEPDRIERQLEQFLLHPTVNVLGCDVRVFGDSNRISHYILKNTREEQQVDLFFRNASIAHPSAMLRKSFLDTYGILYNEEYLKAQDYALWVDCVQYTKIDCLGEVLFNYRTHCGQVSSKSRPTQISTQNRIRAAQLNRLGMSPTDEEVKLHIGLCDGEISSYAHLKHCGKWIRKLKKANRKTKYFHHRIFKKELGKKFIISWRILLKRRFSIKVFFLGFVFLDIFFDGII